MLVSFGSLPPYPSKVKHIAEQPGVQCAVFDQCQFGLKSPSGLAMQKRTKVLTNCSEIFAALNGRVCDHTHQHLQIQGSENGVKLSRWAQVYPDAMVEAICRAVLQALSR